MILGIECTAHTFGIGIVKRGKILANLRKMYTTEKEGIVPVKAAEHHSSQAPKLYLEALKYAKISEREISAIALSNAPGLAPCLLAGMRFAKDKAKLLDVPIIPVNHCIAHLEIGQSIGARDPVLLYTSGANTQIIAYASGRYRVFGETLDLGVGNLLDKTARYANLGFPGGPKIELCAANAKSKEISYIELPYSIKGMDVSFSGIQTKVQQLFDKGISLNQLSFSLQETVFAMLTEAAERALAHTGKKELVIGGGVGCNSRLQEMCRIMCRERNAKFFCPAKEFLVDNGAMIAYTGEIMFGKGISENYEKVDILPRQRTDEVEIKWK